MIAECMGEGGGNKDGKMLAQINELEYSWAIFGLL